MHFVLSYDLSAEGARRREIEQRIEAVLSPYTHVKSLKNFYIIKVSDEKDWEHIRQELTALSNLITEEFYFVMSPLIDSRARYNGILFKGEWDAINKITDQ